MEMFRKVTYPIVITTCISACFTFYSFYVGGGSHPAMLVTSVVNVILCALLLLSYLSNHMSKYEWLVYAYFYNHAIGTILVYMDWLPESFTRY